MRRRHRRALFNLFAFSLLGAAVYLNMYKMNEGDLPFNKRTSVVVKATDKTSTLAKSSTKQIQKN